VTAMAAAYFAPATVAEATRLLGHAERPTVLGGGTLTMPRAAAEGLAVLDLTTIPALRGITTSADETLIGATTSYADLLATPVAPPLLRRIAAGITGGPQIRNQGTIGGSACCANPASDIPAGLVALGATMIVASETGTRRVPARGFFRGPFAPDLRPDEILTHISVPAGRGGQSWGYVKLKHGESSWPLAVTAACISAGISVTIGAATSVPTTLRLPPGTLTIPREQLIGLLRELLDDAHWWSDELADAAYRATVAPVIAYRALAQARTEGIPA